MPALPASPTTAAPVEGDPIRSRHGSAERSRTSNRERGAYGIRTRAAAVRGRCPRPLDECAGRFSVAGAGNGVPMLGRWRKRGEKHRAEKQEGDVHALDREGDPRGGVQSDEYRTADPRDVD